MLAHQALLDLVESTLLAAPALAGGEVHRHRARPIAAAKGQAVRIRTASSAPQPLGGLAAPIDWETRLTVQCLARSTSPSQSPDEAAGALYASTHARLIGTGAATLAAAGYVIDPAAALVWDEDEAEDRIGALTAIYTVRHRTTSDTLAPL